jgi:hypothetical protein
MLMRTNKLDPAMRVMGAVALLATLLGGCSKTVPSDTPAAKPAAEAPASQPPTQSAPSPGDTPPPQPSQEAPPSPDPSAADNPRLALELDLDRMSLATPSAKMSVPAELRYSFESDVAAGQPALLNLAAIPHAPGAALRISVQEEQGLQIAAGPMRTQKASALAIYRQQVSVTRLAGGPANVRVLVRMQMGEDSSFGYFSIPLDRSPALESRKQKPDLVKQP